MSDYPRFHLAIGVKDLEQTRDFYTEILGCAKGRSSDRWIDLDFFGHQLVLHLTDESDRRQERTNPVDGHEVPARHFGPILDWDSFATLADRLRGAGVNFLIEPCVRFEGRKGEQATLFVTDPSGNCLEFKAFRDIRMLFASDLEAYP